jgi:hypothetical protein
MCAALRYLISKSCSKPDLMGTGSPCRISLRTAESRPGAPFGGGERVSSTAGRWMGEATDGRTSGAGRDGRYPGAPRGVKALTKGRAGGKLPSGNLAVRSPARQRSAASRKAARNRWYALVELMTDAASERMEERRGGFLWLGRLVERRLRTHGGGTENRGSAFLATLGGCLLDSLHDGADPRADLLRRQVLPTGQRRESHRLRRRELARVACLASVPCGVFLGAIEPGSLDRFVVQGIADACYETAPGMGATRFS